MSMLKRIDDHRDLILLTEIGALIHDLGKLSKEFIIQQSAECFASNKTCYPECNFDHEQILKTPDFLGPQLSDLLQDSRWSSRLQTRAVAQLKQTPQHLGHFISGHTNLGSGIGLLALVTRCDQVDSGVDKGALQSSAKQKWAATYRASAFGYEHLLPIEPDQDGLKVQRDELATVLHGSLQRVLSGQSSRGQERTVILKAVESAFCQALGETRRAANDVTLWDHACSVASLQKAALAQALLKGWPPELRQLQWRILRVTFDGLQFLEHAHRIPDILGRLQVIREAFDEVRTLLEITLPLGNEIYHDENGSAFIVPDVSDLLDAKDDQGRPLRDRIAEEFGKELRGEIRLDLGNEWFSDPSRYAIELGRLLSKPLPPLAADPQRTWDQWKTHDGAEVCTVCALRPQGPSTKARERNVCDICEQHRGDRAKQWVNNLGTTIWTDEVADINGRLALIAARFDLTAWLDGHCLSSVLAQEPPADKTYGEAVAQLAEELRKNVKPDRSNPPLLQRLAPEAFRQPAQDFYQAVVEERDIHGLAAAVAANDYHAKAELLLLCLLRKNPSFARIRRVWETTRAFWQTALDERGPDGGPLLPQPAPRLEIIPQNRHVLDLGLFHTYELVVNSIHISVVWDSDGERFITCDNLVYLAKPEQLGKSVEQVLNEAKDRRRPITIEELVGYGGKNKVWGTIVIENVHPLPGEYTPAIPILAEPRTFMALVPANKALAVVQAIKTKYGREMGKVRNRLPLHLGIVYADRRTPLRAVLDAGRRMLAQKAIEPVGEWRVVADVVQQTGPLPDEARELGDGTHQFDAWYGVQLENQALRRSLTWYVPAVMGDGATEDRWYPYVFLKTAGKPTDRDCRFQAPNPWHTDAQGNPEPAWLVHAGELKEGDIVYFTSATLDFEFLDTAARRFEIAYDEQGRRRGRPTRPYLLEEMATLDTAWEVVAGPNGLTNSQIHALRDLIESQRGEWRPTTADCASGTGMFWQFCRDAILTAQWPKRCRPAGDALQRLTDWAARGLLADVIELRMGIMQESAHRSTKQEETIP